MTIKLKPLAEQVLADKAPISVTLVKPSGIDKPFALHSANHALRRADPEAGRCNRAGRRHPLATLAGALGSTAVPGTVLSRRHRG